jgi:hypothetical protein
METFGSRRRFGDHPEGKTRILYPYKRSAGRERSSPASQPRRGACHFKNIGRESQSRPGAGRHRTRGRFASLSGPGRRNPISVTAPALRSGTARRTASGARGLLSWQQCRMPAAMVRSLTESSRRVPGSRLPEPSMLSHARQRLPLSSQGLMAMGSGVRREGSETDLSEWHGVLSPTNHAARYSTVAPRRKSASISSRLPPPKRAR